VWWGRERKVLGIFSQVRSPVFNFLGGERSKGKKGGVREGKEGREGSGYLGFPVV